jgi:signal transduction histidine kinase
VIGGPRSLLARILLWHGVAVIVTALAVSAGVYLFLDATADHLARQTLRTQVAATRAAIGIDADGAAFLTASANDRGRLVAGMNVLVLDGQRVVANLAGTDPPLPVADIPQKDVEAYFTKRSRQSLYAGLSVPFDLAHRRLWIVAIQNLDHPANVIDDLVRQFLWRGVTIVLPLLLLLLGVDAFIVRRALAPVRHASALARTIDASRSNVRLADPALPAEVQPLAEAIDSALDRLTGSLRMTREFTADAAHELRTPITVARLRATEIADPALKAALIADLDGLANTVGHLLDIAELDTLTNFAARPVDLTELAQNCIATIAPLAFRRGKTLELLGGPGRNVVRGEPHFLARALLALLENAVKHTGDDTDIRGTHIRVDTRIAGALTVSDDGPGIGADEQELVFRRFWRRNRSAASSSGLGLAIVQRVAERHHGTVTLSSRPGATAFTLRLSPDSPDAGA